MKYIGNLPNTSNQKYAVPVLSSVSTGARRVGQAGLILLVTLIFTLRAVAQDRSLPQKQLTDTVIIINKEQLKWEVLPGGVKVSILKGDPFKEGMFIERIVFPANWKVEPHWHPTDEIITVLKGTLYVGIGPVFTEAGAKKIDSGGFIAMPANTIHYAFTTQECVAQVQGYGPFQRIFVKQASEEPFHRVVFENKFIRILDVLLQPGDTSEFHIHTIPSLFVFFTTTTIRTQKKGEDWVKDHSVGGKAWYSYYSLDSFFIHHISNADVVPLHTSIIEILSPYNSTKLKQNKPLQFPLLFENERALAYRLTDQQMNRTARSHTPLVVQLVSGEMFFHNTKSKQVKKIKAGQFLYIEPNSTFYFSSRAPSEISMVLFEIK